MAWCDNNLPPVRPQQQECVSLPGPSLVSYTPASPQPTQDTSLHSCTTCTRSFSTQHLLLYHQRKCCRRLSPLARRLNTTHQRRLPSQSSTAQCQSRSTVSASPESITSQHTTRKPTFSDEYLCQTPLLMFRQRMRQLRLSPKETEFWQVHRRKAKNAMYQRQCRERRDNEIAKLKQIISTLEIQIASLTRIHRKEIRRLRTAPRVLHLSGEIAKLNPVPVCPTNNIEFATSYHQAVQRIQTPTSPSVQPRVFMTQHFKTLCTVPQEDLYIPIDGKLHILDYIPTEQPYWGFCNNSRCYQVEMGYWVVMEAPSRGIWHLPSPPVHSQSSSSTETGSYTAASTPLSVGYP
jgi:hypothetical protein